MATSQVYFDNRKVSLKSVKTSRALREDHLKTTPVEKLTWLECVDAKNIAAAMQCFDPTDKELAFASDWESRLAAQIAKFQAAEDERDAAGHRRAVASAKAELRTNPNALIDAANAEDMPKVQRLLSAYEGDSWATGLANRAAEIGRLHRFTSGRSEELGQLRDWVAQFVNERGLP